MVHKGSGWKFPNIYVMNRDRVWGLESLLHSGSVSIADGLRGSVDLSVLHDIECAHGQRMGMVLHSAATRAGSDFKDDDKHKVKQTQAWGRRCIQHLLDVKRIAL